MDLNSINPIESIELPGIGTLPNKGLAVIVGPNSAGKTQLLNDISHTLTGKERQLVVAVNITLKRQSTAVQFLDVLESEGYLKKGKDANGRDTYKRNASILGIGGGHGELSIDTINNNFNNFNQAPTSGNEFKTSPFLSDFGNYFATFLFLSNRLTLVNQQNNFDWATSPPENDLQALFLDEEAQDLLNTEIANVFGKSVWVDFTRGNFLNLRIKESKSLPNDKERRLPSEMKKYRIIESEGDGLKSYIGICISLLLGRRPLCLIDEPELCLHPPQAYSLGRFIGRFTQSNENLTIISTHSSHLLRGIIDETNKSSIIRLTNNGKFNSRHVNPDVLQTFTRKPIIRAESILDGIFSNAVVLVEAEGDRLIYETTWGIISKNHLIDIRFVSVGGTGGFTEIIKFYDMLHIPNTIIADLDLALDLDKLIPMIKELSTNSNFNDQLITDCREFNTAFKTIHPSIKPEEVKELLLDLGNGNMKWEDNDDSIIRKSLSNIAKKLSRNQKIKKGGLENFNDVPEMKTKLSKIVQRLDSLGLFLVPVGELEEWEPDLMSDAPSKYKKAEWANYAARKLKENPDPNLNISKFIERVVAFLTENIDTFHLNRTSSNI